MYTVAYTTVYSRVRGCVHDRIHVYAGYMARVHAVHGRVHVYRTVYVAVYTAVFTACMFTARTRPAVYAACTQPCIGSCTRIHGPYSKRIECATFSQTVVVTPVNKAKHHIACHPKVVKYGVKQDLGKDIIIKYYLLRNPVYYHCHVNIALKSTGVILCVVLY